MGDPLDDNRTDLVRQPRRDELIANRFTIVKPLYRPNTFQARDGKQHVRIELVQTDVDLPRLREAVAASSKLDHPNICRVYELVEADGACVLVMELVDGVSLRDRLLLGEFDPVQVVDWLGQLLSALACGHAAGLAHGDVSASNVVIDATGALKLLDFGIVRGPEPATVRADLQAVGVLAQAMFTGDPEQIIEAVPHAHRAWVRTCTSTSSFTDAKAAATALRDPRWIETQTAPMIARARSPHREPGPANAPSSDREAEPAKRRRVVGAIVAAGVVAVGAIAFWLARSGTSSESKPPTTVAVAPTTPRGRPPLPTGAVEPDLSAPAPSVPAESAPAPVVARKQPKITPTGATLAQITFSAEAAWIEDAAVFVLEEAYAHLAKNPLLRVEVGGHSSSDGKDDHKQQIALWRATAVRDYLLKRGIDEKRIEVRSYSDTRPIAPNDTAPGRAQNRRVEIRVLTDGPATVQTMSRSESR